MGSASDLGVMKGAFEMLDKFGVEYDKRVYSAHRTPAALEEWLKDARQKGFCAFIAAAGGAAHLAGVVAAHTTLPVIGVPIMSAALRGIDSLLSTVQKALVSPERGERSHQVFAEPLTFLMVLLPAV